ncbi:anthrone oxygenase family protein [Mucilaginibacter sp. HD30]
MKTTKKMSEYLLLLTALAVALIAGLFYAYSCSVNIGLGQLPDREYLNAMQAINKAILNPWFFASFMGSLVLLPLSTWEQFSADNYLRFYLLLAATIIYIIGVFGITAFGNVPLNDRLAVADLPTLTGQALADLRTAFESPWLHYHLIRTLAAIMTLILVIASCLQPHTKAT